MSGDLERMTDEEIIKWQEDLYELERDCSTGPPMTPEEQMERIKEYLADDFVEKFYAKIEARKKELVQEIAVESDLKKKERLQRNLALLYDS